MRTEFWMTAILGLSMVFVSGCGKTGTTSHPGESNTTVGHGHDHDEHAASAGKEEVGQDHSGWWCNEHGVPEEICALCNSKVAADFQKQGDWCKEHDRPDSQCFKCHPELEAKFAAQYAAKYGKQPPKPEG